MSQLTLTIGNRNYSSWSMRAWLPLRAAGADVTEEVVLLGRDDTAAEISRHSPTGLVPVLRHGDLVIWDSLAIAEYAAELFPDAGLWPRDPRVRAVARSVTAEMHAGFTAVRGNMPMNIRASYPGEGRAPGVDADIARITSIWESCRRDYGQGGDLLFGGFTIADAFYAPVVSRFRTYGVEVGGAAGDYMEALWAFPAVRDWATAAENEAWVVERYER
ncbi:MAG: glutathione S-transferase family protein [Candidatus Sulfomarinibacteraceae bacterium]